MKHLRLFKTEVEYNSATLDLPNVSYVEDNDMVYYYPAQESEDYVMVDLGLPSGLLWADRNVGAVSPEDVGFLFLWGDTKDNTSFSGEYDDYWDLNGWDEDWGYALFNKYDYYNNKLTILELSDDAAYVNMGSDYRMPTKVEMQELIDNTTITFIDLQGNEFSKSEAENNAIAQNNLKGVKFIGSNGNSIFIPSNLWASELEIREFIDFDEFVHEVFDKAVFLSLSSNMCELNTIFRINLLSVRGVKSK